MSESAPTQNTPGAATEPQASSPAEPDACSFIFRHRNILGVAIAVFLVVFPWGRWQPAPTHFIVGFALVLAGVLLRLWSILQIGGAARKTVRLKAVRIISWGPFSLLRNPIYVANATVFAGFTVLSGHIWALPGILIALGLWYDAVVVQEEKFLDKTFPVEYAEYRQSTRRWIPRFRLRRRPADIPPYPLLRAVRRERGHLISVGLGTLVVVVFRIIVPSL